MAASINIAAYSDALVVLGTAGVVIPLVRRLGINPVIGYLAAGAALGPLGLGSFIRDLPFLYWFTVVDAKNVAAIAEFGVVFLLFLIGLELSFARLVTMRRLVFGLGMAQVTVATAVLGAILLAVGLGPTAALVMASFLALSSTAIVIEILSEQKRMATSAGRASFSVLLAQDLAFVPLLLLVGLLGAGTAGSIATGIALAFSQAFLALVVIVVVGRLVLRPLYRLVAGAGSTELFMATTLFIIVATGVIAAAAGLSMAIGAFVAGLLLAETEYRKAIETVIEPFKGLLLGLFFFAVGMSVDIRDIVRQPHIILGGVLGLIVIKALITYALARMFRIARAPAIETALLIGPGGELALVGLGAALAAGLLTSGAAGLAIAIVSLSMALIPSLSTLARRAAHRVPQRPGADVALPEPPTGESARAIVIGHGRVGQIVCDQLMRHAVPYLGIETDAVSVADARSRGQPVYYGDGADPRFLKACGVADARALIITIHTPSVIDEIVTLARRLRPDLPIIARARDAAHARHLYEIGVTNAVPETIEASLQLSEASLVSVGVPMGLVIAGIHDARDAVRKDLQRAAHAAGQGVIRIVPPSRERGAKTGTQP